MSSPALFLDRDGVLDHLVWYDSSGEWESPRAPEDVKLVAGVADALRDAGRLGYLLFVVSNQPSAAKQKASLESLRAVHDRIVKDLGPVPIGEYYYCYHRAEDRCACRKPNPRFVLEAAGRFDVDLSRSWFAGDQDSDVACGRQAGCRTALLQYPHSRPKRGTERADVTFADLPQFVRWLAGGVRDR